MEKEAFMSYDPWSNIQSRNGIPGDELISMLQKSIRRGLEENALAAAYEMYITSPQFHEKMWRRLLAISVEDVGFGNPRLLSRCTPFSKWLRSSPIPTAISHVLHARNPFSVPLHQGAHHR